MISIKLVHMSCAAITIVGFVVRGVWMMRGSPRLQQTWVKVAPHVVDTALLVSGVVLAINIRQYPGTHAWLTAKLLALLAYIVLGSVALKRGRNMAIRASAWVMALLAFSYIVGVAVTRSAGLSVL